MAVPSSGAISLGGIYSELDAGDYTELNDEGETVSLQGASTGNISTINTNNASADRPDGSTPHAMSEFYSYDHSAAASTIPGFMIDDFTGTPTSTRDTFGTTALGDGQSTSDAGSQVTAQRPLWTTLGGGTSHVSNDYIKMSNTSNTNHSQWRTTQVDKRSGVSAASLTVSSFDFTWEFSFYIASAGNKDLRFFLEAGSSVPTGTWNTGGTNFKGYAFTFDDDSTRNIRWQKWTTSGSPTEVTITSNNAFAFDTYQTCKITRFYNTNRWRVDIDGSVVINGVADSTYNQFYGYRFWTAKSGTSVDNRVDWFHTYRA